MRARSRRHRIEPRCRTSVLAAAVAASLAVSFAASAASTAPLNAAGQVGSTSYVTLPFAGAVYQGSWGSTAGLEEANLFWQSGSHFTDPGTMAAARQAAAGWTSYGIVPVGVAQRWVDTYEIAQPASDFPGEPSVIAADRATGMASGPEYQAWVAWLSARPNLPILAYDGGSMPWDWRPWHGSWGHVSPLMPLARSDCPPGMSSCTFGDFWAYRWGQTAGLSGAYGIGVSDFTDSQPAQPSELQGFNPEIVSAFKTAMNVSLPAASTTTATATAIATSHINQWNDYLSEGYGKFYAAIVARVQAATGQKPLFVQQCSLWPALRRFYGTDERLFDGVISPVNYVCLWDDQSMQLGRGGQDPDWGIGGYAIAAAREPDMRNGANIEANDNAYWQAIAAFNPTLSASDQQEKGLKLLKRAWLEAAWAHVATRQGTVRRALAFVSRDYWDAGSLDPTVANLIGSIVPTAPFGFAVYYSTGAERALEQIVATQNPYVQAYYNPNLLFAAKNAGLPVDYFVSDAALAALQPAARPAAWVILEHPELIPAAEMQKLRAVAPVLTSAAQIQAFKAPLAFSVGLTGTAFWDQNGRLVVTVTNPGNATVGGFVTFQGIPSGTYAVTDLLHGAQFTVVVTNGAVSMPASVARWDTQVYAVRRM